MLKLRHLQLTVYILPLLIFFGGMLHIHPPAATEFEQFRQAAEADAVQLGQRILGMCRVK